MRIVAVACTVMLVAVHCGSSSDATSSAPPPVCKNPDALLVGGQNTGFDACDGKVMRRRAVVACPAATATGTCAVARPDGGEAGDTCTKDADCTDKPLGQCDFQSGGCSCVYGCNSDDDCVKGNLCECSDHGGHCAFATCKDASSCFGMDCVSFAGAGCGEPGYACITAKDACLTDDDCNPDGGETSACLYSNAARTCQPATCR